MKNDKYTIERTKCNKKLRNCFCIGADKCKETNCKLISDWLDLHKED